MRRGRGCAGATAPGARGCSAPCRTPPRCSPAAGVISLRDPLFPFPGASLALSSLNKHTEAVVYYKKALELDPDNDTYKSNLKIAEQKMKETPSPVSSETKGLLGGGRVGRGFVAVGAALTARAVFRVSPVRRQRGGGSCLPPGTFHPNPAGVSLLERGCLGLLRKSWRMRLMRRERSDAAALP